MALNARQRLLTLYSPLTYLTDQPTYRPTANPAGRQDGAGSCPEAGGAVTEVGAWARMGLHE